MTRSSRDELPLAWGSTIDVTGPTPSWLAPPMDSQVFPVSPSVEPPPERERELSLAAPSPSHPPSTSIAARKEEADRSALYEALRVENESLKLRLRSCLDAVGALRRAVVAASEPELVRLACAIATRVLRRELSLDPSLVVAWVREAAESLPGAETLTVACAPDVAAVVTEGDFRAAIANLGTVEVDAGLAPMSCEVRAKASHVDASMEGRLVAVVEELRSAKP